jgi:hypothetical protein
VRRTTAIDPVQVTATRISHRRFGPARRLRAPTRKPVVRSRLMPLAPQQPAPLPIKLGCKPALPCPPDHPQGIRIEELLG